MEDNIIKEFAEELLIDAGVDGSDRASWRSLSEAIEGRIHARLMLEIVGALTPEQAARVRTEMDAVRPDPEQLFHEFKKEIPNFTSLVLTILEKIRLEISAELHTMMQPVVI